MAAEKAAARERFRRLRGSLREADRRGASALIATHVLALPELQSARTVHVFWPLVAKGEVDTRPMIGALAERGLGIVLPAVLPGASPRLVHRRFLGPDRLVTGAWGVREPDARSPIVNPADIDVVIVPGLAMGRDGSRLGYGGGYYDSFLATTGAFRVGVVWAAALVETLPTAPHDALLDAVVTEDGVHRTTQLGDDAGRNTDRPRT